jgi:hypothetical protein
MFSGLDFYVGMLLGAVLGFVLGFGAKVKVVLDRADAKRDAHKDDA